MKITVSKRSHALCMLTVSEGATVICEDVAIYKGRDADGAHLGCEVPTDQIAQLLGAAHEMHEFNDDGVPFLELAASLLYGDDWKNKIAQLIEGE